MMLRRRSLLGGGMLLATGLGASTSPAFAQKRDTLHVTWRDAVPDVDFYYNQLRTGFILQIHAWDALAYRDPKTFKIVPLLATSWTQPNPTTFEFELRKGVKFHNGDPFSADDVVYTINTVIHDKKVSVPSNYQFLEGAEKIDDHHVRVKLKRIFPAALEYIAMVLPIWPQKYREKVGADGYSKAPVGAGPYKFTRVNGVTSLDLERFDDYYEGSPKGRPAIKYLKIHEVPDASTELTEILGGQADWIWDFNPDQFDNIARMPTLKAVRAETMRVAYMSLDAAGRTGKDNPLTKQKVRQAIAHAVDRETMAKRLMQGASRPLDAPCYPSQFGCDVEAAVSYKYDPAQAKKLLAEAGYPNGFETEIVSYLLPEWTGAVQNYLQAVGIHAKVSQLQVASAIQRELAGKSPLFMGSWGSYSINDVSAILPYFFGGGPVDYARDPEVERLVKEGGSVTDPAQRQKDYGEAIHRITEEAYWLPLFTYVTYYAFDSNLNFSAFPDELPRFYLCAWK